MTNEEIKNENEKSREKYFYLDKKEVCRFLCTVGASFIGALLALCVFTALHKPPMPPMGHRLMPPRPCPMKLMDKGFKPDRMLLPPKELRGPRGSHFEGYWEFSTPQEKMAPTPNAKFDIKPPSPNTINPEKK